MIRTTRNLSFVARALCSVGVIWMAGAAAAPPAHAIGTWQAAPRHQGDDIAGFYLLTDGTVLANGYSDGGLHWYTYKPDAKGDYTKGTWSNVASSPWGALYYVSFTLNDGQFWMAGGEYVTQTGANANNHVQVYDPVANTWTQGTDGMFGDIGDTSAVLLPDGSPFVSTRLSSGTQIYNLKTKSWSRSGNLNAGSGDEETWQTLADGTVFDCLHNPPERYLPSTGQWIDAALCPISISQQGEEGPMILLQDGRLWCISDTGPTAIYNPPTTLNGLGTWTAAAPYPNGDVAGDTPGAILTNGKAFVVGAIGAQYGPSSYYEYDATTNSYATVPDPPGGKTNQSFTARLLELPTGQILYTGGGDLAVYTPEAGTGPKDEWRPVVTAVTPNQDGSYQLTGTQITGRSFGANYGDDFFDTTNFPIVYLTDKSGNVFYCKTSDYSTRAICTGSTPETCKFTVPAGLPAGSYSLFLSVNGVANKTAVTFPPIAAPVLTTLTPATVGVGSTGVVLTLTGSSFAPTATVVINGGAPITPTSITATKITVNAPASILNAAGAYSVQVHNLGSPSDSSPSTFTVATPSVTSLNPSVVAPGTTGLTLSISGAYYQRGAKVSFNGGAAIAPTYVTGTLIQVPVPNNLLAASGTVAVTVIDAPGAGGSSAPAQLSVTGPPTLSNVSPAISGIGGTGIVLTLTGTDFNAQAKVLIGSTTVTPASVTPTQITVAVPASVASTVANYGVWVQNPGNGNKSAGLVYRTVSPVLNAISPSAVSTASAGTALTITGQNFVPGSTVLFSGTSVTPTSVTSTKIVVLLPASVVQTSGTVPVSVMNAPGAGGTTASASLTVASRPTITTITPHLLATGGPATTMTINGTDFEPGATVSFNDTTTVSATLKSSTEISVVAPASLSATTGTYFLRVVNVGAGNASNAAQYNVAPAQPVITSLSPSGVAVGITNQTLYVYGTGFVAGSVVTFNNGAPVTPSVFQAGRLAVAVPAAVMATVGTVQVRVVNGAANGGTSTVATLTVAAHPVVTDITPSLIGASAESVTITLTGSNFDAASAVSINDGAPIAPTTVTPTQITVVLPSSVSSTPGQYYARVVNTSYYNSSNPIRFTVTAAPSK